MSGRNQQFYSPDQIESQKTMLGNRVVKNFRHRQKLFKKKGIDCFRVYDRDIPEIRLVVDYYAGDWVVGEYVRKQTEGIDYLQSMVEGLATALELPMDRFFQKSRQTKPQTGQRYHRLNKSNSRKVVHEGPLKFLVNLEDYIDTGLFFDHRKTRGMVAEEVAGKSFLNLFAYTGSFTCYAAQAGASQTTTVDVSKNYIQWAQDNLELNDLSGDHHQFVTENAFHFLQDAAKRGEQWDIIVLDPPSYSTKGLNGEFSILEDHPQLITLAWQLLADGGTFYFSTNHQAFQFEKEKLPGTWQEKTKIVLPEDYKGKTPHRLFVAKKEDSQ